MADGDYRAKENSIRIRIGKQGSVVKYVSLIVTICSPSTFQSWGKQTDVPTIEVDGKLYRVNLEPFSGT